jgi:hypothetical protein
MTQGDPQETAGVREGQIVAGKYRVERVLGIGGMGVVVAAHHLQLDEKVAIKFLLGASGQGTVPKAALAKISAGAHAIASNLWVRKISLPAGTCVEVTGVITNVSAAGGIPFGGDATFL